MVYKYFHLLAVFLKIEHSGDIELRRALACVFGNISSQIIAIRKLVFAGLDIQAKQLLRVLIENIDVALLISRNEDALNAFKLTADEAASNDFWHKYVSKRKARAIDYSDFSRSIGVNASRELKEYIRQEEKILGMTIHPSLGAGQLACVPTIVNGVDSGPFTLGFLGGVSALSERTISYAVFYMIFYVFDGYFPKKIGIEECDEIYYKGMNEFYMHIMQGRIALLHIWPYAFENRNKPELSTSFPDVF